MSEPDQLYIRVHISRPQLNKFLQNPVGRASEYPDFLGWLADKDYYGDRYTIAKMDERTGSGHTAQRWIEEWTKQTHGPWAHAYNDSTGIWTFSLVEFAENYDLYINALNTFRRIEQFKDTNSIDYILIYPYLYANTQESIAAVEITKGNSRFILSPPKELITEADAAMEQLLKQRHT